MIRVITSTKENDRKQIKVMRMLILKSYSEVPCHKGKAETPVAPAGRSGWWGEGWG